MLRYTHKQKLTVPNSLALAAAAILVWSANGSPDQAEQYDANCSHDSAPLSVQHGDPALPSMRATPQQCSNSGSQLQAEAQPGSALVKSARTAGLRLLFLPAKALVHN